MSMYCEVCGVYDGQLIGKWQRAVIMECDICGKRVCQAHGWICPVTRMFICVDCCQDCDCDECPLHGTPRCPKFEEVHEEEEAYVDWE